MAGDGDMQFHEGTYGIFTRLFKYGAVACFVIAFFVIWLIAS